MGGAMVSTGEWVDVLWATWDVRLSASVELSVGDRLSSGDEARSCRIRPEGRLGRC
jgi:hypothetical protein